MRKFAHLALFSLVISITSLQASAAQILFAHVGNYGNYVNDGNDLAGFLSNAGHSVTTRFLNTAVYNDYSNFDQIFVYDLYAGSDQSTIQQANYARIGQWYNGLSDKNLILDGRIISSAPWWTTIAGMPSEEAFIQNYATQLDLRGGGLVLGTDHNAFQSGINNINDYIGVSRFFGNYHQSPYEAYVDPNSPLAIPGLASCTNDNTQVCVNNNSSSGYVATNVQPNGQILTPVAYHAIGTNTAWTAAAISTTMGSITFGTCGGANQPPCDVPAPGGFWLFGLGLLLAGAVRKSAKS